MKTSGLICSQADVPYTHTLLSTPGRGAVSKGSTLHLPLATAPVATQCGYAVSVGARGGECGFFCNSPPQSWEANAMGTGNGTGQSISQSIEQKSVVQEKALVPI